MYSLQHSQSLVNCRKGILINGANQKICFLGFCFQVGWVLLLNLFIMWVIEHIGRTKNVTDTTCGIKLIIWTCHKQFMYMYIYIQQITQTTNVIDTACGIHLSWYEIPVPSRNLANIEHKNINSHSHLVAFQQNFANLVDCAFVLLPSNTT